MKYIMFVDKGSGARRGVMFPGSLTHKTVADGLMYSFRMSGEAALTPISAGFVAIEDYVVNGCSESLGLDSDPDDSLYLWGGDTVAFLEPFMVRPIYQRWLNEKDFR